MDGTLLRGDGNLAPRTLAAMQACQRAGIRVVIATGRCFAEAKHPLPEGFAPDAWICEGGARVHAGGRCLHEELIPADTARDLVQWLQANYPTSTVWAEVGGALLANRPLRGEYGFQIVDLVAHLDRPVGMIVIESTTMELLLSAQERLPANCRMFITDGGKWGLIMAARVSKADALRRLLDHWDLALDQAMAIGNDTNDIEFIAECGDGVAMDNAIPEAKSAADLVTASNDEDGVAQVLEALVQGEIEGLAVA